MVPHFFNLTRKLFPVHQVSVTVQLTLLDMMVVLFCDLLFLIDFQCIRPLLEFLVPVFG
jgi:hypothetical protein